MPRTHESQVDASRLREIPLDRLIPFPGNANVMPEEYLAKLQANIEREQDYPPLVVRPHPTEAGAFELLDGEQRRAVLLHLGYAHAHCYLWPCDDATALILHTTLNRLEGDDEPWRRAALLRQLGELMPVDEIAQLVPEDEAVVAQAVDALDRDVEGILKQFAEEMDAAVAAGPKLYSFAVEPEEALVVDDALDRASAGLSGTNRRGQALVLLARAFLAKDQGASTDAQA